MNWPSRLSPGCFSQWLADLIKGIPADVEFTGEEETMNKILMGLLLGLILGALDGATAWFTPAARPMITGIMVGSSIKGMLVGLLTGWFARKVQSVKWGVAVGAGLGLFFAFLVAAMPQPGGQHYYLEIMLPGFVVGAIIGFLTQTVGNPASAAKGA
jgi:hypothetical protein